MNNIYKDKHFNPSSSLIIFVFGVLLVMFKSNRLLYVRFLPESLIFISEILIFIIYIRYNSERIKVLNFSKLKSILIIILIWVYDALWIDEINWYNELQFVIKLSYLLILLSIDLDEQIWVLKIFIKVMQCIIALALGAWLIFLLGVPLPHFTDIPDAFYIHTIYPFFVLNGYPELTILPRFAGPFLDPGHLGTMCVFILYINGFKLRNFGNIILLIAIFLSLSLAAYGLMIGAIILTLINKKQLFWVFSFITFIILCGIGAMFYNDGDNPINQAIVLRLEMDENGEMVGNNRTTGAFDKAFDKYLDSRHIYLGVGYKAHGTREDSSDNILLGCASYKRYFYTRGIIGSVLIIFFLLYYYYVYCSKRGLGFLIIYLVANCIRDYPTMEMWIYVYILALPYLKYLREQ